MNPINAPWVATARTILQNIVGVTIALVSAFLAFAAIAPEILGALREVLPEHAYLWLLGIVGTAGAIAGAIARVMAIPAVNAWLGRLGYQTPADTGLGTLPRA